jgi:GWxTD domain-containing protein
MNKISKKIIQISTFLLFSINTLPLFALPIFIRCFVADQENSHRVYAFTVIPRLANIDDLSGIRISYFVKASQNSNEILRQDTISLNNAQKDYDKLNFSFDIPYTNVKTAILYIKVIDEKSRQDAQEDFLLGGGNTFVSVVNVANNDLPDYVVSGEEIKFLGGENKQVTVYRIPQNFQAAAVPMQIEGLNTMPELKVDSTFTVMTNTPFKINTKGLYFAQLDTNSMNGTGFRVSEPQFPKYKTVYQLIEPLIYISDYSEISPINTVTSTDAYAKKLALDSYWLTLAKEETKAKKMIKLYYQRIADANTFFTTYKEGWKTDKGMIYIAFGRPDVVNKIQSQEQWIYRGYGTEIKFTFMKRNNQFTTSHYDLIRDVKYTDAWYQMIERWRMGLVTR